MLANLTSFTVIYSHTPGHLLKVLTFTCFKPRHVSSVPRRAGTKMTWVLFIVQSVLGEAVGHLWRRIRSFVAKDLETGHGMR